MRVPQLPVLCLILSWLFVGGGCPTEDPGDDDQTGDDDTADDDSGDDDGGDDDSGDDDAGSYCDQDGSSLENLYYPQLEAGCPVDFLDQDIAADTTCLGSIIGGVDFEVVIAGEGYTFEPTHLCAVTPWVFGDLEGTQTFTGFALSFASEDFQDYLTIYVADSDRLEIATHLSLADPLCEPTSSWNKTRFFAYAKMNGHCYIPGPSAEAVVSFDYFTHGTPAVDDYYWGDICASLPVWDYDGARVKLNGSFELTVSDGTLAARDEVWDEVCP